MDFTTEPFSCLIVILSSILITSLPEEAGCCDGHLFCMFTVCSFTLFYSFSWRQRKATTFDCGCPWRSFHVFLYSVIILFRISTKLCSKALVSEGVQNLKLVSFRHSLPCCYLRLLVASLLI